MFGVGEVRFLKAVIVGRPTVGHQEVEDGRMVGDLGSGPANHERAAVYVLDLCVDGGAAAHCKREEEGQEVESISRRKHDK